MGDVRNNVRAMARYKLSKRKIDFARYYFDFDKVYAKSRPGNAYRSALQAGYSDSYSKKILSYTHWRELETLVKMSENDSKC